MSPIDEYLPYRFRQDVQELTRTRELVEDVARTFERFVNDSGWPYELEDKKPIPPPSDSQSTNAMILFALAAAAGRIGRDSPLLPMDVPGDYVSFGEEPWNRFAKAWGTLVDAMKDRSQYEFSVNGVNQSHISWSSSFGWDDPFTLTWLLELCRSRSFGELEAPVRDSLTTRAAARVGLAFRFENGQPASTEGPFLTWHPASQLPEKDKDAIKKKGLFQKGNNSLDHSFPLLRFVQLRESLRMAGVDPDAAEDAVRRSMQTRVHEQLSRAEISDGSFDPSELVFALEGMLLLEPNLVSRPLLERALTLITRSQAQSPYWRPVKPFVSRPQGDVLFAISVETATSLLRCCALSSKYHPDQAWFSNHVGLFAQYVDWLRVRHRKGECPRAAAGDPSGFRGWHSEHVHLHQGIHLWETSQVLLFLVFYAAMLDGHIAEQSLKAANLTQTQPWKPEQKKWHTDYWDNRNVGEPLAGLPKESRLRIFDGYAREHLILPRPHPDGAPPSARGTRHFSALLYGPPGTGKTSFAEELCKALRWPLITITPSDFIHGGESQIEARAKLIFEVLAAQRDVVVLFDEIDRLILDRDSTLYEAQGDIFQFMTPSMLTKLRELWKRKRVIFLIATNYEERIDAAIKRRGRIDERCLVAPPDQKGREIILQQLLMKHLKTQGLPPAGPPALAKLASVSRGLRLMVYGELKQFFEDAVDKCGRAAVDIVSELERRADRAHPAIRLLSYRPRFEGSRMDGKERRGARPLAEFLLLTYLRLEGDGRLDHDEKELVRRVLASLGGDWEKNGRDVRKAALAKVLEDTTVEDALLEGLERELSTA